MSRFNLLIKITALAGAMMITTVLSAWVVFSFLTRGGDVEVPDLTGQEIRAALEIASRSELGLKVTGTGHDPSIPPGHIVSQDPRPGVSTRKNRIIRIVVSQGTPTVLVPNLTKLSLRRARLQLTQAGLTLGNVSRSHNLDTESDSVVTQTPDSGQLVSRGRNVDVLLSNGVRPKTYLLPDMTGLPIEVVLSALRSWGLASGRIIEVESSELPPGTVLGLKPEPGSDIIEGQSVHLTVTRTPQPSETLPVVLYRYEAEGFLDRNLKLVLVNGNNSTAIYNDIVQAGNSVTVPVTVFEPGILEVYVDGSLVEEKAVP